MSTLLSRRIDSPVYRTQFDPTATGHPSSAIVDAVSTVTETPPLELQPLHETIDMDAVEMFLIHASSRGNGSTVAFEFTVEGWDVLVGGDGCVEVYES